VGPAVKLDDKDQPVKENERASLLTQGFDKKQLCMLKAQVGSLIYALAPALQLALPHQPERACDRQVHAKLVDFHDVIDRAVHLQQGDRRDGISKAPHWRKSSAGSMPCADVHGAQAVNSGYGDTLSNPVVESRGFSPWLATSSLVYGTELL
jgi:hypothetical protein